MQLYDVVEDIPCLEPNCCNSQAEHPTPKLFYQNSLAANSHKCSGSETAFFSYKEYMDY